MKTFNYESNCVRYSDCFFYKGEYSKGKIYLKIYGREENNTEISYISNATVNVDEKLLENQIVIDDYSNSNLISFLMDLGIVKKIVKRVAVKFLMLPVVEVDLDLLKDYCFNGEKFKYAS